MRIKQPVELQLGPKQANVLIDALTEWCIDLADDVRYGDATATRDQRIALNLRVRIATQLRKRGLKSNW